MGPGREKDDSAFVVFTSIALITSTIYTHFVEQMGAERAVVLMKEMAKEGGLHKMRQAQAAEWQLSQLSDKAAEKDKPQVVEVSDEEAAKIRAGDASSSAHET